MEQKNKNGKAAQGAAAVAEQTTKPATSEIAVGGNGQLTQENGKAEQPAEEPVTPQLTVEDKIRKVFALNDLIEKRGLLKRHQERVEAIKFGEYEDKDILTISGSAGQPYAIKSTVVCKKISALLKEEITGCIAEVEKEINALL